MIHTPHGHGHAVFSGAGMSWQKENAIGFYEIFTLSAALLFSAKSN